MDRKNAYIPLLYHKTKVLILDDSQSYLDSLTITLGSTFDLIATSDHKKAIQLLNVEQESVERLIANVVEEKTISDQVIEIDISNLYKMIYNKKRFEHISVVIVDYKMPEINGIEFCDLINNKNIKIILLTAVAGDAEAVQAFNDGKIDKFFSKNDSNLDKKLFMAVDELQLNYFSEIGNKYCHNFSVIDEINFSYENYFELFNKIKLSSQAIEYYLIDKFGSALFLDPDGSAVWLIIRIEKEIHNDFLIAQEQEAKADIISALENKEKLLFQLTEEDRKKSVEEWKDYLFDTQQSEQIYYSVIKGKTKNNVLWDRAIFYNDVK